MNEKTKKLVAFHALIIATTLFVSIVAYSILSYYTPQISTLDFHEIWIDKGWAPEQFQDNIVVNQTTKVRYYLHYIWKEEALFTFSYTNEVFRDKDASYAIQWAINHTSGMIYFHTGTYNLNHTITVDSSTFIKGGTFTCSGRPFFQTLPNCTDVTFSNVTLWDVSK